MQVTIRNPQYAQADRYRFAIAEFVTYTGVEVQLRHVGADAIALSTGRADWPVRVIPRAWVISINGEAYSHTSGHTTTQVVRGSRGEEYVVSLGARPSCTCTGFAFRKTCRHIL